MFRVDASKVWWCLVIRELHLVLLYSVGMCLVMVVFRVERKKNVAYARVV